MTAVLNEVRQPGASEEADPLECFTDAGVEIVEKAHEMLRAFGRFDESYALEWFRRAINEEKLARKLGEPGKKVHREAMIRLGACALICAGVDRE